MYVHLLSQFLIVHTVFMYSSFKLSQLLQHQLMCAGSVQCKVLYSQMMRECSRCENWNRIKVEDGPGAGWQGEGEGRQGVGEGGADGTGEENGSNPDNNMLTITVQVQP